MSKTLSSLDFNSKELVVGLVAPVGTDLTEVQKTIKNCNALAGYKTIEIKLSSFLTKEAAAITGQKPYAKKSDEYRRIKEHIAAGDSLREQTEARDILALFAAAKILSSRKEKDPHLKKTCHVLNSVKTPEEVEALRKIYGASFFLVGVYSAESRRKDHLEKKKGLTKEQANELVLIDSCEEDNEFGQNTSDTFFLADVFINVDAGAEQVRHELNRFLELVFGNPHITPTFDEYAMFHAFGAALRSGDLSRQVGAVVASAPMEIVALGANDVPSFPGGLYWPGELDKRDHIQGFDANAKQKRAIEDDLFRRFTDVLMAIQEARKIPKKDRIFGKDIDRKRKDIFGDSMLADVTEYHRAVHAEMDALISCARSGVETRNTTLYVTTYPCHNCAKHIVAAGVRRVVFVEPYPKSLALELHSDSIKHGEPGGKELLHVSFEPFIGVSARRYIDLFSMKLSNGYSLKRKQKDGNKSLWAIESARQRLAFPLHDFLKREASAFEIIKDHKDNLSKKLDANITHRYADSRGTEKNGKNRSRKKD